ncbi:MAG: glycosyltransferase family 39 protein [Planctomycetota bacterium]|nr:glycosyltransferase family 39 protein [Planctomycetota bacterium]
MDRLGAAQERRWQRAQAPSVFVLAFVVLALFAWERDLFDADEGRYASVAANMAASGDWVVPHLNGMPFMDKPPLVYWVQAVPTALFGRTELFARLPTLLAGAIWVLMIFLLASTWTGSLGKAWWAALLAMTSMAGIVGSRVGPQMDMPLAAAVATALYAGWLGLTRGGRGPQLLLGLAVGCGLLIKGPLVAVVPTLVAVGWVIAGVPWRSALRLLFSPWAWAVAVLVAAPWYVLVERAQPGWIAHFITYEHFGRFSTGDHRSFNPFWFYVPIVILYLAPWTPLGWGGYERITRGGRFGRPLLGFFACSPWGPCSWDAALPGQLDVGERRVRAGRIAWAWFLAAFLLYSISTRKLLNYLLPAAAPLFVLIGARLHGLVWTRSWQPCALAFLAGLGLIVAGALVAGGLLFPFATGRLPSDLEVERFGPAGPWLMAAGVLMLAGVAVWMWLRQDALRAPALVLAAACGWWCMDLGLSRIDGIGSSHRLATALINQLPTDAVQVSLKRYPQGNEFYGGPRLWIAGGTPDDWAQREIVNPYARRAWEAAGGAALTPEPFGLEDTRGGLLTGAQFEALWASDREVLVICRWGEIQHLGGEIVAGPFGGGGRTDLFLLRNRPQKAEEGR